MGLSVRRSRNAESAVAIAAITAQPSPTEVKTASNTRTTVANPNAPVATVSL